MRLVLLLFFLIIATISKSQPSVELNDLMSRYSDSQGVYIEKLLNIEVRFDKNKVPFFHINQKDILMVLSENTAAFSTGKEIYGYGYHLKKISAYTLVPGEEKYQRVEVKDFVKTSEIGDGLFYDDRVAYNYTYPSVCKGSKLVFESEYAISKPEYPVISFFGTGVPESNSVVNLRLPENVDIRYKVFGLDTTSVKCSKVKQGKFWNYVWQYSSSSPIIPDTDAPSFRYIFPHLVVTITGYSTKGGYNPVIRNLDDLYEWNYNKVRDLNSKASTKVKKLSDSITAGIPDNTDKVRKIFRWVQKNIMYIAIEDGENGYIPRDAELVLERRYGDCKDKSSLLKALMQAQGIKSSLAWVGSRQLPYKYSEFPSIIVDNHMIAVYWDKDGSPCFLDGTTLHHPFGQVPSGIQGKECLIENGPGNKTLVVIPVSQPRKNLVVDSVSLRICGDTITGNAFAYLTGEPKVDLIERLDGVKPENYKNIIETYFTKGNNKFKPLNVYVSEPENIDSNLTVKYDFSLPNYFSRKGENIFINLNLDKLLQEKQIKPDRIQPIEQQMTILKRNIYSLEIPEGYEIQKVPENSKFENDKFSFTILYDNTENRVTLTKEIKLNYLLLYNDSFSDYISMLDMLNKSYIQTVVLRKKTQ